MSRHVQDARSLLAEWKIAKETVFSSLLEPGLSLHEEQAIQILQKHRIRFERDDSGGRRASVVLREYLWHAENRIATLSAYFTSHKRSYAIGLVLHDARSLVQPDLIKDLLILPVKWV
jgi:hypothetical protein